MSARLTSLAGLVAILVSLASGTPVVARPGDSAFVRSASLQLPPAREGQAPSHAAELNVYVAREGLDAAMDPATVGVEVRIGRTCVVSAAPGDGTRWRRQRGSPWIWQGSAEATPGCPGRVRLALDLLKGRVLLRAQRIDLSQVVADGPTNVAVGVRVDGVEFGTTVDFDARPRRWRHHARMLETPTLVPVAPPPPVVPPVTPPPSADGPVAHRVLAWASLYRQVEKPGRAVVVRDAQLWNQLWQADNWSAVATVQPSVDFDAQMVATFAGSTGDSFASVRFERSGDSLVGHLVIRPTVAEGGYQPRYDLVAAFAVPLVTGTVTYEVSYENAPSWYADWELTLPTWDGSW